MKLCQPKYVVLKFLSLLYLCVNDLAAIFYYTLFIVYCSLWAIISIEMVVIACYAGPGLSFVNSFAVQPSSFGPLAVFMLEINVFIMALLRCFALKMLHFLKRGKTLLDEMP